MGNIRQCCRRHWGKDSGKYAKASGSTLFNPTEMLMMLCQTCGNKRCPKATDCRLACTGSNDPGQVGSVYGVERNMTTAERLCEKLNRLQPSERHSLALEFAELCWCHHSFGIAATMAKIRAILDGPKQEGGEHG